MIARSVPEIHCTQKNVTEEDRGGGGGGIGYSRKWICRCIPKILYLMVADFMVTYFVRYYTKNAVSHGSKFHVHRFCEILHHRFMTFLK